MSYVIENGAEVGKETRRRDDRAFRVNDESEREPHLQKRETETVSLDEGLG
jgi:hypothetical protein